MLYILLILLLLLACALLMRSISSCKRQALALSQTASKLTKTEEALSTTKAELEAASGKIQALERDFTAAQCDQRDLFFARLLCGGHFQSLDALLADGKAVKVSFPGRCFLVLAAKLETWGEMFESGEMDRKDAYFILRNTLEHGFPGVTNAAELNGSMVAILNLPQMPETGIRGIVQDAHRLLEVLEQQFGLEITVSISRVYVSPMELPHAMQDAALVQEYLTLLDEDRPVTAYEQLSMQYMKPSSTSFVDLESRLMRCVTLKDVSGMRLAMHELISNEFGDTKPTVDTFRFRVYGVVNTLLYLMNDIRELYGNEIVDKMDPGPRLTSANTLSEIVETMDDMLDMLEAYSDAQKQSAGMPWVPAVYQFVLDHYTDPDLTVSFLADRFHFTPTYCAKIFKDHYGIRLFDFIQRQRLAHAKQLLPTGKTMAEISEESGFSSTLTMSRAFKRYEGAAPSVIREQLLSK